MDACMHACMHGCVHACMDAWMRMDACIHTITQVHYSRRLLDLSLLIALALMGFRLKASLTNDLRPHICTVLALMAVVTSSSPPPPLTHAL